MPLPDNLLNPIPGASPGGENLRYVPVYDKIKEARREEEDLPQGDWEHEVKTSDPVLVTKLATEALANKSKDLQIAAWLTEACMRREGYPGLKEGLDLIRGLLENFWDTLHPEIEDGDLELRAAPLDWIGNYFPTLAYRQPLTQEGYDWRTWKECRAVPTEAEAAANESKATTRSEKLAEGRLAPETFDEDVQRTPKQFYKDMVDGIEAALESLQSLSELADSKFGNQAPSFGKLRAALEELQHLGRGFLKKKQEADPDPESSAEETTEEASGEEAAAETTEEGAPAKPRGKKALTAEPADKDDAVSRVMVAAKFWRTQEPLNPAPYLMVRGMRWGELRAAGPEPDQTLFDPPPTELRQQMKRLSLEGNWAEVLDSAETAAAMPCGRAWLDVHRYSVKACENLGGEYAAVMLGILSGLRGLLADYPQLPEMTLMDDTPVANAETVGWIKESVGTMAAAAPAAESLPDTIPMDTGEKSDAAGAAAPPDAYEIARQMVNEGRAEAAIEMLANEVANERSGRTRFQRMIQLASLCMATSHERIAYPILMELSEEIDRRKLEDWEPRPVIAQPLALLYRCLVRMGSDDEPMKKKVYERVCRLDPIQALSCLK